MKVSSIVKVSSIDYSAYLRTRLDELQVCCAIGCGTPAVYIHVSADLLVPLCTTHDAEFEPS